jgi:hypothetical protein
MPTIIQASLSGRGAHNRLCLHEQLFPAISFPLLMFDLHNVDFSVFLYFRAGESKRTQQNDHSLQMRMFVLTPRRQSEEQNVSMPPSSTCPLEYSRHNRSTIRETKGLDSLQSTLPLSNYPSRRPVNQRADHCTGHYTTNLGGHHCPMLGYISSTPTSSFP